MPGLLSRIPLQGLLQPVVFDRLRAQRGVGLLGEGTSEGAPGMRGGGGGRTVPEAKMPATKFRWERNETFNQPGYEAFQAHKTTTPSGINVYMDGRPGEREVSFFTHHPMRGTGKKQGTGRSLDRFSD